MIGPATIVLKTVLVPSYFQDYRCRVPYHTRFTLCVVDVGRSSWAMIMSAAIKLLRECIVDHVLIYYSKYVSLVGILVLLPCNKHRYVPFHLHHLAPET